MSKNVIKIHFTTDYHDCETCGYSYAQGAMVFLNDEKLLDLEPYAYCFSSVHYTEEDVYYLTLRTLGYELKGYETYSTFTDDVYEEIEVPVKKTLEYLEEYDYLEDDENLLELIITNNNLDYKVIEVFDL